MRRIVLNHDQRVHALILHFHPLAGVTHEGAMIGGGVEIFRRAAVALHSEQFGVAGFHRGAAQAQQLGENLLHRLGVAGVDLQAQVGRIAVGAADAKLLHFEAAVEFDHLVEDLLHHVGVDQVALGLDEFLQWKRIAVGRQSWDLVSKLLISNL